MPVDDRYFGEIWVRHFRTRNEKPLSRVLIRRIVELIHDRVTKDRPLHDVLSAHQIPETQFAQVIAESKRSRKLDGD
jgi:hypothetical protein